MTEITLDKSTTALLMADVSAGNMAQNPLVHERQTFERAGAVLAAARHAGIFVTYCISHFRPGYPETRLLASGVCGFPVVHTSSRIVEPMEKSPIRRLLSRGKHPPYTTFDSFFRLRCARHTPPDLRPQTHPCFPCCGVSCLCAAPVTHQAQGSLTSRSRARRLPLARSVPQKTLGSLPCPIVYSVQISWLPRGSNFYRAHGRGVARFHNPVVGHLSRVETGTNQIEWLSTNFSPSLQPQPSSKQTSAKSFRRLKGHEVSHDVIARS